MVLAVSGVAVVAIAGLTFMLMNGSPNPGPTKTYKSLGVFHEERAAIQDESGKWGFIGENGKELVKPQYDAVMPYKDGFAVVQLGCCSCGYINKEGIVLGTLDHKVCNQPVQGKATVIDNDGTTRILSLK